MSRVLHLIALAHCLLAFGCWSDNAPKAPARTLTRIALVGVGRDHPTWPVLLAVARQIEGTSGRIVIRVEAPPSVSPAEQQKLLESLVGTVDIICLEPADPLSLSQTINDVARNGAPVITFGRDAIGSQRSVYCGPMEADLGETLAEACGLLPRSRSNSVLLLHGGAENAALQQRYEAMRLKMVKSNGMSLLREVACGESRITALAVVKEESRKYPRSAGWALLDDWPFRSLGANDRLVPEGYGVVMCQNDPRYLQYVEDGRITALVTFDYRDAVQGALFAGLRLLDSRGTSFSPLVSLSPQIVTVANSALWRERWIAWQTGQVPPTTARATP
ncbi:MAG: substrate-binding domain-containing protein [Planctomycetes bacterium]|nr:substrate-binding domain-containing protein [Planctomycetota bacterium]